MKEEMDYMKISLDSSYEVETNRNIQNIEATIKILGDEDDEDSDEGYYPVATIKVRKVLDTLIHSNSLLFQMDSISQEMLNCFEDCLHEDEEGYMRVIGKDYEDCSSFIYIEELRVNEDFRGIGLGKVIVQEVIRLISGEAEVLIVLPFAIDDRDNDVAHERVQKFWQSIGFTQINNETSFHAMLTHYLVGRKDFIDEL